MTLLVRPRGASFLNVKTGFSNEVAEYVYEKYRAGRAFTDVIGKLVFYATPIWGGGGAPIWAAEPPKLEP